MSATTAASMSTRNLASRPRYKLFTSSSMEANLSGLDIAGTDRLQQWGSVSCTIPKLLERECCRENSKRDPKEIDEDPKTVANSIVMISV
ncbi:hypothetical protein QJS04_geneDACA014375 [Acorus gramineus]|uniref:Uncharacterized protein n=1 Tax=Acorus gramineus TaxID=55184 RepID=A0AAV9A1V1_ACOGR|nr:hypothetical protein QJS04_geneDACA014375 [Acorus gramineus]